MRMMKVNRVLCLALAAGGSWALCPAAIGQEKAEPVAEDGAAPQPQPSSVPTPAEGAAPAAPASPGREVFEQARAAILRGQAFTYHGKYYGTGTMEMYTATVEADVRLMRTARGPKLIGRAVGTGKSRSVQPFEFDVAWRDITNEWVDHANKKVFEKNGKDSKGVLYAMAGNTRLDELIDAQPFKNELAPAAEYEVESPVEFAGVQCESILVTNGRIKVRWFIGQQDKLPRKREAILNNSAVNGTMVLELHDIKSDENRPPRMTEEMVRVAVPEGYTEDRVAPPPPPPPPPVARSDDPKGEARGREPKGEETAPAAPAPQEPPAPVVQTMPEFELSTPSGEKVSAASLRGKVAVLEFGGSWCLSLRDAHPELHTMAQALKERGVVVYHVNVREKNPTNETDPGSMVRRVRDGGYAFGVLLAGDEVARAFGVKRYPAYVVVDRDGKIVATEAGFTKASTIVAVQQAAEAALGVPSAGASTAGK